MPDRPADSCAAAGHRPVRSYVLREGRLTAGQRRALEALWPKYGLDLAADAGRSGGGLCDGGDGGFDGGFAAGFDGDFDGGFAGSFAGGFAANAAPTAAPDYPQIFGRNAPLHLEIGFGDGEALLEMAARNPHCDFLGAEVHRPGVGRALLQIEARQVANIRLFRADGFQVLSAAVAPRALAALYLYFPDPWPKKRHHKRRLLQPRFIELAASRLATGGHFHFATDWRDYAEQALARLEEFNGWENCAGRGRFSPRPPARPQTKFERRGQRLGHPVWDVVMRKTTE